jgi:hypothetical protein
MLFILPQAKEKAHHPLSLSDPLSFAYLSQFAYQSINLSICQSINLSLHYSRILSCNEHPKRFAEHLGNREKNTAKRQGSQPEDAERMREVRTE